MNQFLVKALSDEKIINSWKKNANPWISAIEQHEIESRIESTNYSIITEITNRHPSKVLDIGCGEGWLVDELSHANIDTLGIDAIPDFIEHAKTNRKGRFRLFSYKKLSNMPINEKFDIAVCNFSLLGNNSVKQVFKVIPSLLRQGGLFIVQTIHPMAGGNSGNYKDGWRKGSWASFNKNFTDPAPWYFRTLSSWLKLFTQNRLYISSIWGT